MNILPSASWIRTLFYSTLFCFAFLAIRNLIEVNQTYNFLIWNLFLGFIPLVIAYILYYWIQGRSIVLYYFGLLLWLLFYPNAPYMITDLIHVEPQEQDVIYDTLMIFSFSILSLFYGFYSISIIQAILRFKYSVNNARMIIIFCILLSSFGIYLGRILRLNSWDLFTRPLESLIMIWNHLYPITDNPITYIIIILFTAIQFISLNLIRDLDFPLILEKR